jgi:fructose-1,6-bisphosphatase/inositol monophosphatase family enzyme
VTEKFAGELVTIADREAETRITARLRELLPGVPVVGEEAVAANPGLLHALNAGPDSACWLVDPLDGTANFVAGRREFAVMVALVRGGETVSSWIWLPLDEISYAAERGGGAYRNGERLIAPHAPDNPGPLRGAILQKFLTPEQRTIVARAALKFADIDTGQNCAGVEYPRIAEGTQEFVRFQRLRPWDHAPGTLLLEEAGGYVRRWDGSFYSPGTGGTGLLAATSEAIWNRVRTAIPLDE